MQTTNFKSVACTGTTATVILVADICLNGCEVIIYIYIYSGIVFEYISDNVHNMREDAGISKANQKSLCKETFHF